MQVLSQECLGSIPTARFSSVTLLFSLIFIALPCHREPPNKKVNSSAGKSMKSGSLATRWSTHPASSQECLLGSIPSARFFTVSSALLLCSISKNYT
jgi:hypothetical protein